MTHPPLITLKYIPPTNAPTGEDNTDQFSPAIPQHFIQNYTKPNDIIFDPFLGFGTTAFTAEEQNRIPYGIEADGERFEWAAGQLEHWQNIRHADAADTATLNLPKMDACITSPPFMKNTGIWNPLYGGDPDYKGYKAYQERIGYIFTQIAKIMKKDALIFVQVDNITEKSFTPLIRDFSQTISSKHLRPTGETTIIWQNPPKNYPKTTILIFKKT